MRTTGDVIRSLRQEKYLTQKQLASELHVAKSTIGMWENGVREPNKEAREAICDFFNVDMNYLFGRTCVRNEYRDGSEIVQIPLCQELSSLEDLHSGLHCISFFAAPSSLLAKDSSYFAVIAADTAMSGYGINDRDIMIFRESDRLKAGQIAYVCFHGQSVCRKACPEKDGWALCASNENCPDMMMDADDPAFSCLGILIAVIRRYPH